MNKSTYPLMQRDGGLSFSVFMLAYVLISFVVQAILLCFTGENSVLYLAISSCLSPLTMFLVLFYQTKNKGRSIKILSLQKPKVNHILLGVVLSFAMLFGLGFINLVFADFLSEVGVKIPSPQIPLGNILEFLLFTFTLAILPAVFEELFFRGLLLSSLSGEKIVGKVLTISLCFALYHCSITQFLYQFIYGACLAILMIYAKSVIPGIVTHFLNNFLVLLFTYLKVDINLKNPLFIGFGLLVLAFVMLICCLGIKKQGKSTLVSKGQKAFYLPYGIFGIITCLLILLSIF